MNADLLDLDFPPGNAWAHPPAPRSTWEQHLQFIEEFSEMLASDPRLREMLGTFEEVHRGERFVMHD